MNRVEEIRQHTERLVSCLANLDAAKDTLDQIAISPAYTSREKEREVVFEGAADMYENRLAILDMEVRIGKLIGEVFA